MKSRIYGTLIASLGAVTLLLAANETSAASRAHGGSASAHSVSHRLAAHLFRHHRQPQAAVFWPGDDYDDSFYGPTGDSNLYGAPPFPGGVPYTNTNGIPWDWAHRYPPAVARSDRPYVSNCADETVTVPDGHGGKGEVNITRCY